VFAFKKITCDTLKFEGYPCVPLVLVTHEGIPMIPQNKQRFLSSVYKKKQCVMCHIELEENRDSKGQINLMVACENFSQLFIEKINKIQEEFPNASVFSAPVVHPSPAERSFCDFVPVSEDQTRKAINASPCKSCMLDPWPTFLVRECLDILITPKTSLIKMCLSEGVLFFPISSKQLW
jgi:hypothetical protein